MCKTDVILNGGQVPTRFGSAVFYQELGIIIHYIIKNKDIFTFVRA